MILLYDSRLLEKHVMGGPRTSARPRAGPQRNRRGSMKTKNAYFFENPLPRNIRPVRIRRFTLAFFRLIKGKFTFRCTSAVAWIYQLPRIFITNIRSYSSLFH